MAPSRGATQQDRAAVVELVHQRFTSRGGQLGATEQPSRSTQPLEALLSSRQLSRPQQAREAGADTRGPEAALPAQQRSSGDRKKGRHDQQARRLTPRRSAVANASCPAGFKQLGPMDQAGVAVLPEGACANFRPSHRPGQGLFQHLAINLGLRKLRLAAPSGSQSGRRG